ncbi:hypothetical protein BCV69DRAFT_296142 [Microstroma glucosiphilum]|uniref:Sensitive to high expression protein 9, mitochondrial n=1 Tax=Pseudomicrostroma glucosiphilum TaxID=1684307 RepID=A0A316UF49_9BASI|nr:hypothetical protein BCV69DRAFT_296142 [Pseudomicrostroma glucosiphilum]PWN23830.1 hypothetical protein BCV69DRAFT_296142 [Pseudomicrostroma glucosiphilum]
MSAARSLSSAVRIPTSRLSSNPILRPPRLPSRALQGRFYSQQKSGDSPPASSQDAGAGPSSSPTFSAAPRSPSSSSSSSASSSARQHNLKNAFAPHWQRLSSSIASHRTTLAPKLRSELTRLGDKWNIYSGYDQIESAKKRVIDSEQRLEALRTAQNEAKSRYVQAVTRRSTSQKTINDLLSRKASWSDEDLIKYTSLLRAEHGEAREEEVAREEFDAAEREVGKAWDEVVKRTLERYHDEQIWSDRVRNVSSYTQLAVVGLNVFIFALAILLVEPYKRRKLAETFESRLIKGEEQGRLALEGVIHRFDKSVQGLSEELQEIKTGQSGLLAVAGVAEKQRGGGEVERSTTDALGPVEAEVEAEKDVLSMVKRRTRFLHSPRTEAEKERRLEVAVATSIGAVVGTILWGILSRS